VAKAKKKKKKKKLSAAEKELEKIKRKSWSRLSEQNFRVDKWNLCRGHAAARSDGSLK
jgi:hypothetical protein